MQRVKYLLQPFYIQTYELIVIAWQTNNSLEKIPICCLWVFIVLYTYMVYVHSIR